MGASNRKNHGRKQARAGVQHTGATAASRARRELKPGRV